MGLAKFIRALQRGGVALRCGEGGYRVWRCQNRKRRALGVMRAIDGDALRADGKIILMEGEHALYHWVGSVEGLVRGKPVPPPAVLLPRRKRRAGRGLLARALDEAVDERDRQRLADAAARFLGDVERAAQPQHVTMNWSSLALGSIDGTRSHGNNLPGYSSARALERLKAARAALGEDAYQILDLMLAQEASAAEFARRRMIAPARAPEQAAGGLRTLADVYDRAVSAG